MRPDLKAYAKKLVSDGVLSKEYFNQLSNREYFERFFDFPSETHIETCLSGSTTVDLASSIRAKEVFTDEFYTSLPNNVCKALIFIHSLKSFDIGESPLKIPEFSNKVFKILFQSCFMSSEIWHKMLKSHPKPSCAAILQLMSLGFSKNTIMSDKNVMNNVLRDEQSFVAQSLNWLVKVYGLKEQFLEIMQTFGIMCIKRHQMKSVETTDNLFQTASICSDHDIFILE